MILLITSRDGVRDVVVDVDRIQQTTLGGSSRTKIQITLKTGRECGEIELHDARVELLPDDPDAR